jgi:transcriptional regulator with XRE-family HTH domain
MFNCICQVFMPQKGQRMQRFGEKLRALRTQRGMTLKELALELGLSAHGYISELESGKKKPTAELVLNVARLFDVSTDQLLKDELDLDMD